MICKVVRLIDRDRLVVLHISGHIQEVHINIIDNLLKKETDSVALDLGEVTLADREAVKFLASVDARGVGLRNCPEFIREWMRRL
jgi:ATP-dependent Lon protease